MTDTPTSATAATGPEPAALAAAPEVDYAALLDSIPEDVLLKHRRVNGMVGSVAQRLAERQTAAQRAEAQAKAIRDQEQAMIEMAQTNPFEFSQKWLGDKSSEVAKREFSELEAKTQHDILDSIGQSYGQVDEWKELTQEEFADVAQRTSGLTGAALISAFNAAAIDKVAEKRAGKRVTAQFSERLAKEKEAWEREAAAARLRGETIPSMDRAQTLTGRFDPRQLSDEDFNAAYDQWFPNR